MKTIDDEYHITTEDYTLDDFLEDLRTYFNTNMRKISNEIRALFQVKDHKNTELNIFLDKFINSSSIISFENKYNSYIHSASSKKNEIIEKILKDSFNPRLKNICCIVISNNIVIYNINDNSGAHRINNSLYNNQLK